MPEALTHDQHFEQAGFTALSRHPPPSKKLEERFSRSQLSEGKKTFAVVIRWAVLAIAIIGAVGAASLPSAFAQCPENNYYRVAGAGDWSLPENWQHEEWDLELEKCVEVPGVRDGGDNADLDDDNDVDLADFATFQVAFAGP